MDTKKFTQFGTFTVSILAPFFILSLILLFTFGLKELILGASFGFLALTMFICLLIFYKLTITIDDFSLSFSLGVGLIRKRYLISDILSCLPVKNTPFFGYGIRVTPDGWLYNVSGLYAIELTFKNKTAKIRIGTDRPDEIAGILNSMIKSEKSTVTELPLNNRRKTVYLLLAVFVSLAIIFPSLAIISGHHDTEVVKNESSFSIKGMYGLTIRYSDILQLDTLSLLPRIGMRTNGYAFAGVYKGNFRLKDQRRAKLFVRNGNPPYIFISTRDLNIYINLQNPAKTLELFKVLKNRSGTH